MATQDSAQFVSLLQFCNNPNAESFFEAGERFDNGNFGDPWTQGRVQFNFQ